MLTLAICDDSPTDIERITNLAKEWCAGQHKEDIRVQAFTSPYSLLEAVASDEHFDIFILDILMPEMTGISLGERLGQLLTEPLLIYLTSSEDYYPEAFRLYAFQYICKPVYRNSLFAVLDKALSRCAKRKNDVFVLKTTGGIVRMPLHTIVYVELLSHICHFHLMDGQHLESLYLRTSFDSFVEPLTQQERFVKTHTSFVANLDFAVRLTTNSLSLVTGRAVPVARSFAGQVQRSYLAFGLRDEE